MGKPPPQICFPTLSEKKKKIVTCHTWHVTCDTWHMTWDMWDVTCCGGRTCSKLFSSLAVTVWDLWYFEIWRKRLTHWLTEWIKNETVCRTALAKQGLLIFFFYVQWYIVKSWDVCIWVPPSCQAYIIKYIQIQLGKIFRVWKNNHKKAPAELGDIAKQKCWIVSS